MKMKQLLLGVFAVAAAVLCGAGCARVSCPGNAATPLAGSAWKLDLATLSGTQSNWAKPANAITLSFAPAGKEAGRVSGCAGVNRYFGPVTYDEAAGTIRFGTLGATMMAGPGLEYERAYLKMLAWGGLQNAVATIPANTIASPAASGFDGFSRSTTLL